MARMHDKKEEKGVNMTPYEQMKRAKTELGVKSIKDLLVLSPQNDPFYMGSTGDIKSAEWFMQIWNEAGYQTGVHLRRIHYRLVSKAPAKPDGRIYENTDNDWKYLTSAAKFARYLGMVDISAIIDRRNPDPIVFDESETEIPRVEIFSSDALDYELAMPALPKITTYLALDTISDPYKFEIWCEKSTMNDILEPLCLDYRANLVTGMGELSITAVQKLIDRAADREKPTRIFYISDFDPAGAGMPVAVSRKIEFMAASGIDIKLYHILLTADQCEEYDLPRTPIKESELRRKSFEATNGGGATELDALEALYPGEFEEIVQRAILNYRSWEYRDKVRESIAEYRENVEAENEKILEKYEDEIAETEMKWHAIQKNYEEWRGQSEELYQTILDDIEDLEFDEYNLPEPPELSEMPDPLYSSDREYLDQLARYKQQQGKVSA